MNVELKHVTPKLLREYNENAGRPYFIADSVLLDGGAVELEIGGVTIAGIFHDYDAYELALGVLDMEAPERPEERIHEVPLDGWEESSTYFDTPEENAEMYSEEELEYEIWSKLTALHLLRSRQEDPHAALKAVMRSEATQDDWVAYKATQRFASGGYARKFTDEEVAWHTGDNAVTLPHVKETSEPIYIEPIGAMTHEEVAEAFDKHVTGARK